MARRRGSTLIEFALVVPILIAVLLGIMEFGWLAKNHQTIANATREGARVAALGKTTTEIQTRIREAAKPITLSSSNITLEHATYNNGSVGAYQAWPGDDTTKNPPENRVPRGNLIRVTVRVRNPSLTNFPYVNNRDIVISVIFVRE